MSSFGHVCVCYGFFQGIYSFDCSGRSVATSVDISCLSTVRTGVM